MNDEMYHRGPDDAGVEIYEATGGYGVSFAQRRLSILDLSDLGHQPMHDTSGRISLVYNGEIYNFDALNKYDPPNLEGRSTVSDTNKTIYFKEVMI